mmetsp:Transcript_41228/g.72535  ORF Transcript_41228/g.72535 Transcript_41228/m.72535 type:complete len:507 (+) Transcript_41228:389-1909(+)
MRLLCLATHVRLSILITTLLHHPSPSSLHHHHIIVSRHHVIHLWHLALLLLHHPIPTRIAHTLLPHTLSSHHSHVRIPTHVAHTLLPHHIVPLRHLHVVHHAHLLLRVHAVHHCLLLRVHVVHHCHIVSIHSTAHLLTAHLPTAHLLTPHRHVATCHTIWHTSTLCKHVLLHWIMLCRRIVEHGQDVGSRHFLLLRLLLGLPWLLLHLAIAPPTGVVTHVGKQIQFRFLVRCRSGRATRNRSSSIPPHRGLHRRRSLEGIKVPKIEQIHHGCGRRGRCRHRGSSLRRLGAPHGGTPSSSRGTISSRPFLHPLPCRIGRLPTRRNEATLYPRHHLFLLPGIFHLCYPFEGGGIVEFASFVFITDESLTDGAGGRVGGLGDGETGLEDGVYLPVASVFHEDDFLFFPLIQIHTPHKTNMRTQPPMTSAALQTTKGTHGKRAGWCPRRRFDEGGPSRLPFWTVAADLIFRAEHLDLEPLFEFCLRHGLVLVGSVLIEVHSLALVVARLG